AGYDPHELANMFEILEKLGGGKGPEWLSDHPNPGNRFAAINKEADLLNVQNAERDTPDFHRIQARLHDMPGAPTMQEIAKGGGRRSQGSGYPDSQGGGNTRYPDSQGSGYPDDRTARGHGNQNYPTDSGQLDPRRVSYPSSSFRTYDEAGVRISVPDNWRELP